MTTAKDVLGFEAARLGNTGQETWEWYPLGYGTAWCCAFQSMCLSACGISTKYAWVSALFDDYRNQGRNSYDIRSAQPGDLVAFEWGSTPGGYDHVAMIIELTASGAWTRNGNVNGSKVADLWFPFDGGGMAEIGRPPYSTDIPLTKGKNMRQLLTKNSGIGVEFACVFGNLTHRWQDTPGGTWGKWAPVVASAPPVAVDSVTARVAKNDALEVIVWDSASGRAFRSWQTAPASGWTDWVEA